MVVRNIYNVTYQRCWPCVASLLPLPSNSNRIPIQTTSRFSPLYLLFVMAASPKKIIVVIGATGNQGSSVAHTFLARSDWHVRCLTRNPSSTASKALEARGAEVVQGDLADPSSLAKAFEHANAIFLNTSPWEKHTSAKAALEAEGKGIESANQIAFDYEIMTGKNAVIAAAAVPSLERFIYSALNSIKKASNGKYTHAFQWESNSTIVEYIEKQPELATKSSLIYTGAYHDSPLFSPTFDPASKKYCFMLPAKKEVMLPIINAKESLGPFVYALVEDETPGKKLIAYDSLLTIEDVVNLWSKASGKEAMYVPVSIDTMREKFGVPIEVLDVLAYVAEYGFFSGVEGVIQPSQLKNKIVTKSYEDWLKERNWEEVLAA